MQSPQTIPQLSRKKKTIIRHFIQFKEVAQQAPNNIKR